jgi:hypothetical protein
MPPFFIAGLSCASRTSIIWEPIASRRRPAFSKERSLDEKTQRICLRAAGGGGAGGGADLFGGVAAAEGHQVVGGDHEAVRAIAAEVASGGSGAVVAGAAGGLLSDWVALRTQIGYRLWNRVEKSFFERMPGYALIRSLTQRLAGEDREAAWKLAEVEEALVPAFIIEELADGRFTVFVPSIPTPLAGAVHILSAERVHPLNVPFTQAIKTISRWGSGSKDLVAALEGGGKLAAANEGGR